MNLRVSLFGQKDVGRIREQNQDDFIICQDLQKQDWQFETGQSLIPGDLGCVMAVADGMGGAKSGEIASDLAIKSLMRYFGRLESLPGDPHQFMMDAIQEAHKVILRYGEMRPETQGMGTTLVLAWLIQEELYVAWCGDSRAYLYRKQQPFLPLTDDHSLVWELVQSGQLTPEEARLHPDSNIITQSLGSQQAPPQPEVLASPIHLEAGDRVLLCSDGLNGMLPDEAIESILQGSLSLEKCGQQLIQAANEAGGQDNITVALLEVQASGPVLQEMAVPILEHAPVRKRSFFKTWLPSIALFASLLGFLAVVWLKLQQPPAPSGEEKEPVPIASQEKSSPPADSTQIQVSAPEPSDHPHPVPVPPPSTGEDRRQEVPIIEDLPTNSLAPQDIQQAVTNIQASIRRLTQADRINILLLYKPLEEAQFNRLQFIQQRTHPNDSRSISRELATFLEIPASSTQGIQIKNANMQATQARLAQIEQELREYEAFLTQLEQ